MFSKLKEEDQINTLKYLINQYILNRDEMYSFNGYTNSILQVLSDSYSHKRKSTYGVCKIQKEVESLGINNFIDIKGASKDTELFFLLTDKSGKKSFDKLNVNYKISLKEPGQRTKKYPDALIRIGDHYFLVEHKQMKEDGGDQDKTIEAVIKFASKKPELENLHYVSYVDGVYLVYDYPQDDGASRSPLLWAYFDKVNNSGIEPAHIRMHEL